MAVQVSSIKHPPGRPLAKTVCAAGAGIVGLALVLYYGVPVVRGTLDSPFLEMMLFVLVVGLVSLLAALGYGLRKRWGWYAHLVAAVGSLVFPGALFEFKVDLYHMLAWASTFLTLAMVIWMCFVLRKKK